MLFKGFVLMFLFIFLHIFISFLNEKTFAIFFKILFFSILIFPIYCSFYSDKKNKEKLLNLFETGFILSTISIFSGILLMLPFSVLFTLKFKLTAIFFAAIGSTSWLLFLTKFSFTPIFKKEKPFRKIALSFKMTKKNYCKLFTITLKTYIGIILIMPTPWAIKNYAKTITKLYNINKNGGDDGV